MKWMKTLLIAIALIVGMSGLAAAQEGYHGQRRDDDDGDRQVQGERRHDRNGAYRNNGGYRNNRVYRNNDGDRDDGYRNNNRVYRGQYPVYGNQYPVYGGQYPVYGGQYPVYGGQYPVYGGQYPVYGGQSPYYGTGMQEAQRNGYQYGLHDGQIDRQANRSFRAQSNETYEHANVGYVSAYGPRANYQQAFRQAYMQGYQRGYGAAGPYNGQYGRVPWGR